MTCCARKMSAGPGVDNVFFFFGSMRVIFHSLFDVSLGRAACMT